MKRFIKDYKQIHPVKQGILIVALISILTIICLIVHINGITAWNIIISPIFLFSFYNPIITAIQQKMLHYLFSSVLIFIFLLVCIYFAGSLVSNITFSQSYELQFILLLLILFFFLFNILCQLFKGILHLLNSIDN